MGDGRGIEDGSRTQTAEKTDRPPELPGATDFDDPEGLAVGSLPKDLTPFQVPPKPARPNLPSVKRVESGLLVLSITVMGAVADFTSIYSNVPVILALIGAAVGGGLIQGFRGRRSHRQWKSQLDAYETAQITYEKEQRDRETKEMNDNKLAAIRRLRETYDEKLTGLAREKDQKIEALTQKFVAGVDALQREKDAEIRRLHAEKHEEMRRRAADLVWFMHRHFFVDAESQEYDSDYRLSLFLLVGREPGKKSWVCYGRTGKSSAVEIRKWAHVTDMSQLDQAGLLSWCSYNGPGWTEVPGIPEERRGSVKDIQAYQRRCKTTESDWQLRSWRYATLGIHLARRAGRIPFVLVIERESGLPIQSQEATKEELTTLVQYAAEFWCAPEGDSYDQL